MAKPEPTRIEVWLDNREEALVAVADQRDFAAWESAPENDPERHQPAVMTRYVAWHAARRAGQYSGTFDRFSKECYAASAAEAAEKPEGEESQDPSGT